MAVEIPIAGYVAIDRSIPGNVDVERPILGIFGIVDQYQHMLHLIAI